MGIVDGLGEGFSVALDATTILYVLLGVLALQTANGTESSSEGSADRAAQGLFGLPAGRFLVGIAALAVVAAAGYHVYKGVTKSFLEGVDTAQASPSARRTITRLGQAGYPAKGLALLVVGGLLGWAAITFDASKAAGLDGALRTVLEAPFGKFLLTLIALGLAAFGAFCFARARYPERA